MKIIGKALALFCSLLVLWSPLVLTGCDTFRKPSQKQLSLLKAVYEKIGRFELLPTDKIVYEWQGQTKERFEKLTGRPTVFRIEIPVDIFQLPTKTIELQAGDCEDLAILFVSAARALEFPAKVVVGKLKKEATSPFGTLHVWAEIFLNGKWQIVDPTLSSKVSFDWFFSRPHPSEEVIAKFNEKEFQGSSVKELQKREILKIRSSLENYVKVFLIEKYRMESGKELNSNIRSELEKITQDLITELMDLYLRGVPDDPREFVRPHDPLLREWIKNTKTGRVEPSLFYFNFLD